MRRRWLTAAYCTPLGQFILLPIVRSGQYPIRDIMAYGRRD